MTSLVTGVISSPFSLLSGPDCLDEFFQPQLTSAPANNSDRWMVTQTVKAAHMVLVPHTVKVPICAQYSNSGLIVPFKRRHTTKKHPQLPMSSQCTNTPLTSIPQLLMTALSQTSPPCPLFFTHILFLMPTFSHNLFLNALSKTAPMSHFSHIASLRIPLCPRLPFSHYFIQTAPMSPLSHIDCFLAASMSHFSHRLACSPLSHTDCLHVPPVSYRLPPCPPFLIQAVSAPSF